MAKTEEHCWWMRRKEIEASQLNEALNNHPPFLSFCGLTLPKRFCCCVLRGLCCLQNRQCHREQQAGKTSSTDGWQDLPPEDLNVLESLRNQGVVGWSHHCPKSRLESCRGQSHSHPLPHPSACGEGECSPKLISVRAHQHPYGPSTTLAHRCCEEKDQEALQNPTSLSSLSWCRGWGALAKHQAPLLVTSAGTKCSSTVSLLSTPHVEQPLCVLQTP